MFDAPSFNAISFLAGSKAGGLLFGKTAAGAALLFQGGGVLEQLWEYSKPFREFLNKPWALGKFELTIANFVIGLGLFFAALLISRWMRGFLERRLQARPHIDPGIQYTILRLLHYTIVTVGALYGFKIAFGADLTTLAVVFTALSVGIGFGLQFIAGDLASGFILLFERPLRVGDFISVTGPDSKITEGRVTSINLRTTVVQTNDHISVIVPNSKLVNQNLVNWSYGGRRSRISVPVGVSYEADVELVTETLLRAAEGVQYLLADPKPSVQFMEFGASSLNFRLLVWTDRPRRYPQIKSDINYRIRRLFVEAGIEIPYEQLDLNVRSGALQLAPGGDGNAVPNAEQETREGMEVKN